MRAFYVSLLTTVIFITFSNLSMAQTDKDHYKAWIEKDTKGDQWTFKAQFRNDGPEAMNNLSYRFKSLKNADGSTSNSKQSDAFEAKPGEKITLATQKYNAITSGQIELILEILHKETPIARDSLDIKP